MSKKLFGARTGPVMRRTALVAAMVLLAGCTAQSSDVPDADSGVEGGGAFPVTIEHEYGSTTIEREPRRVVAIGLTDIDPILALGVVPVGFIDWYGEYDKADIRNGLWPWSHDLAGDAEPDLLIAQYSGMTEQEYELASQIAPTVAQSADYPDFEMPWDLTTRRIGEALGGPTGRRS